jgi:formylglycine-generating enzyme
VYWLTYAAKQHTVRITKPFYLGESEVTRGQFAKFVKATGYLTDAETEKDDQGKLKGGWGYGDICGHRMEYT